MNYNYSLFIIIFLSTFIYLSNGCNGPDSDTTLLKWSSVNTWPSGKLPTQGSFVNITNGMRVLLDMSPVPLQQININAGGQLVFSSTNGPLELITGGILIEGRLDIGDDGCRFKEKAIITLTGIDGVGYYEHSYEMARKFIGVLPGGKLELHGYYSYPVPTWVNLNKTVNQGDTLLTLSQDVSQWPVGSQIVVGSTDFDYLQSEQNEIVSCPTCASNQLMLKSPLSYYHFGEITYGVDERAEIGLLTKSIVVRGQMQAACNGSAMCRFFNFDTYGGHIKIVKGFGSAHIQGIEVYNMGQTYYVGYYPIHFHMAGDVDTGNYSSWPSFVKDCSIHHTLSRCLTIHGTSGLIVVNNFAYDHIGHCYFFEDSSETRNYLDSNVGLVTRYGYLLPSDRNCELCLYIAPTDFNGNPTSCGECAAVSTFWVTNPNNVLRNNVAGGSVMAGFWYLFSYGASGLSAALYPNVNPEHTALGGFSNNKAHSNQQIGMNVDQAHQIVQPSASTPYQYLSMTLSRWKPRADPMNVNSAKIPGYFYRYVAYKNNWRALWARGGDMIFHEPQFADNAIGATLASEGEMPADPDSSQVIIGGLFVGQTDNIGQQSNGYNTYKGRTIPAWYTFTPRGFELYDGPISVSYCSFVNFNSDGVRNMSAIGFVLHNDWIFNPKNKFFGNNYINTNTKVISIESPEDGAKNEVLLDADGTMTGTAGASVVHNNPYFFSPKCVVNTQWNMSACYEKFGVLFVYNTDIPDTVLPNGVTGVVMIRDQYPNYRHVLRGVPTHTPHSNMMPLVMIGRTYTMHFTHPSPPKLEIQMTHFDQNDEVTVGICYPKWGVNFSVQRKVVVGWKWFFSDLAKGNSIADVNNDLKGNTYFYDNKTGILNLKFKQSGYRDWNQACPTSGCEYLTVTATGWAVGTNSGDCTADAYGNGNGTYVKKEYATRGGCNGAPELSVDQCGICGGNGQTCGLSSSINSIKAAGGQGNTAPSSNVLFLTAPNIILFGLSIAIYHLFF